MKNRHQHERIVNRRVFLRSGIILGGAALAGEHDPGLTQLLATPFILNYRDDPRFAALCQKLEVQRKLSENGGKVPPELLA